MQMNMPLPANTLPMMTGAGRYGDIEMGGMFTVVKIRADIAHGDYRDPGWYQAPAGSVAYAWEGIRRRRCAAMRPRVQAAHYGPQAAGAMEH